MHHTSTEDTQPVPLDCRPRFDRAADWLASTRWLIRLGRTPWPPATRAEYLLAAEHYPHRLWLWLLDPRDMEMLGLPRTFGRVRPLPVEWRERLLATLAVDADFRRALRDAMGGAA